MIRPGLRLAEEALSRETEFMALESFQAHLSFLREETELPEAPLLDTEPVLELRQEVPWGHLDEELYQAASRGWRILTFPLTPCKKQSSNSELKTNKGKIHNG